MNKYQRTLARLALAATLLGAAAAASAAELGTLCWVTEAGQPMRFSVTQSGTGRFTYTGIFADNDGGNFAIIGQLEAVNGGLVGSFSGSKTTTSDFKTAIYRVVFDGNLVGTGEGIRQKFDRQSNLVTTEYRNHTLTPRACP